MSEPDLYQQALTVAPLALPWPAWHTNDLFSWKLISRASDGELLHMGDDHDAFRERHSCMPSSGTQHAISVADRAAAQEVLRTLRFEMSYRFCAGVRKRQYAVKLAVIARRESLARKSRLRRAA